MQGAIPQMSFQKFSSNSDWSSPPNALHTKCSSILDGLIFLSKQKLKGRFIYFWPSQCWKVTMVNAFSLLQEKNIECRKDYIDHFTFYFCVLIIPLISTMYLYLCMYVIPIHCIYRRFLILSRIYGSLVIPNK